MSDHSGSRPAKGNGPTRAGATSKSALDSASPSTSLWVGAGIGVAAIATGVAAFLLRDHQSKASATHSWVWNAVVIAAGLTAIGCLVFLLGGYLQLRRAAQAEEARAKAEELRRKQFEKLETVTGLATLLQLNQDQIGEYHRIATQQAGRSFKSSQRAMWVGLTVVIGSLIWGVFVRTTDTKVFLGAVGTVAAALSAFLNQTYLRMYDRTLSQLNRYFEQPVLTGYYLTAERLAKGLAEDQEREVLREIVSEVLAASTRMSAGVNSSSRRRSPASSRAGVNEVGPGTAQARSDASPSPSPRRPARESKRLPRQRAQAQDETT